MGEYANVSDVQARISSGRVISAGSSPSTTDVTNWITQAEATVDGEMLVQGLTVPVTNARGVSILQALVTSYVYSRWLDAVTAATDLEGKADSVRMMKEFTDFVTLIRDDVARAATMLGQAPGTAGGATVVRSYPTDNADGFSIGNGDFQPTFTKTPSAGGSGPVGGGAGAQGRW